MHYYINSQTTPFPSTDMLAPSAKNAMSNVWPYYYQVLAWKGLREDILQVYHQCLIDAPWNQYQPDLNAMELMVRVSVYFTSIHVFDFVLDSGKW